MKHIETEVRFLEVDVDSLKQKLATLHAEDQGEDFLKEIIFYDKAGHWQEEQVKMVRLRSTKRAVYLSYKHNFAEQASGTQEIEVVVSDFEKTRAFLKEVGLVEYRHQEKYRHTYALDGVTIDIDRWPKIPAYVELESENEEMLKAVVEKLDFDWEQANKSNAAWVIENVYNIPVRKLKYFTFSQVE